MKHRHVIENLSAYLDGRTSARQTARIEAHLRDCPTCRAELESLRATVSLLQSLTDIPLPGHFTLPAGVQRQQTAFTRWNTAFSALRSVTVAVALVFLAFVAGDVYLGSNSMANAPASLMMARGRCRHVRGGGRELWRQGDCPRSGYGA